MSDKIRSYENMQGWWNTRKSQLSNCKNSFLYAKKFAFAKRTNVKIHIAIPGYLCTCYLLCSPFRKVEWDKIPSKYLYDRLIRTTHFPNNSYYHKILLSKAFILFSWNIFQTYISSVLLTFEVFTFWRHFSSIHAMLYTPSYWLFVNFLKSCFSKVWTLKVDW